MQESEQGLARDGGRSGEARREEAITLLQDEQGVADSPLCHPSIGGLLHQAIKQSREQNFPLLIFQGIPLSLGIADTFEAIFPL